MGTNEAAEPDEPMFVLLARDPFAPQLTNIWALLRIGAYTQARTEFARLSDIAARRQPEANDAAKAQEAALCAVAMIDWKEDHDA